MPLVQVTKAINSCISPQCADDLFAAGVDEEEEVDELSVESEPEPVLTHKEKMLAIKKKYKLSIKALSDYRFVFQRFDKNNNGIVDSIELKNIFHYFKEEPTDGELKLIAEKYGSNENGFLDFPEFVSIIEDKKKLNEIEQKYLDNFQNYDTNGDGFISKNELLRAVEAIDDVDFDYDELHQLANMVNKNGDGCLNYHNYVKLLSVLQ